MKKTIVCADCITEGVTNYRAPVAGAAKNRCCLHDRAFRKASRARAAEARVQRVYGLAPGEYQALYEFQDGRCPICLTATGTGAKRLAVDHDHVSGEVRGLLNARCNHDLLGFFDEAALLRAIQYLRDPPARRMRRQQEESK